MPEINIASLSESTPYIQKLKKALEKATGQPVPIINVLKLTRTAGVSVRPVEMDFGGGQSVTFLFRQGGDVFRVKINDRDFAMSGDLSPDYQPSFDAGIREIAKTIVDGQKAFQKKNAMTKVVVPRAAFTPKNTVQKLKEAQEQEAAVDVVVAQKTEQRDALKQQLEQKAIQTPKAV